MIIPKETPEDGRPQVLVLRALGLVLAGRLELHAFAACIANARLVISADTGAAHLDSAYARPSIMLFGPVSPDRWGPPPGHTWS